MKVLNHPTGFSVQRSLNESLLVNPDGSIKEVYSLVSKGIVCAFLALKLNGGMKRVQVLYELDQLNILSQPKIRILPSPDKDFDK